MREQFYITDEGAEEMLPSGRQALLSSRAYWARTGCWPVEGVLGSSASLVRNGTRGWAHQDKEIEDMPP